MAYFVSGILQVDAAQPTDYPWSDAGFYPYTGNKTFERMCAADGKQALFCRTVHGAGKFKHSLPDDSAVVSGLDSGISAKRRN